MSYEARLIIIDDSYWYSPSHDCKIEYRSTKKTFIQKLFNLDIKWLPIQTNHHTNATIFGSIARSWKEELGVIRRARAEEIITRINKTKKLPFLDEWGDIR